MVVKIVEKCGAEFTTTIWKEWPAQEIYGKPYATLTKGQKDQSDTNARERYLAVNFILNANKNKFSKYRQG